MKRTAIAHKGVGARIVSGVIFAVLLAYSLTILALYIWVLFSSFKTRIDFNTNIFGFPKTFTFDNYKNAIANFQVPIFRNGRMVKVYLEELLLNSFLYILGSSIAATLTPAIVAYATSKFDFAFNMVLDCIVILTMVLPIIGAEAATIQMTKILGLYDRMIGMYFMKLTFLGFNYLLFKSAFRGVDKAFSESAYIDGASEFRVMVKINFPMVASVLAIVFALQLMGFWADWTTPLMYIPHKPTVAYALYELQFSSDPLLTFKPLQFAACILASLPTLIVFIVFRDKMMGGIEFGGIK